jgi:hypothetical protein
MSNQIQITGGAKVRNLEGVLTGTSGVVSSLGINVPSGIPQLDGSGKILVSQLPNSVMEYKGTWDASTNTPTLVDGTGNAGDVYLCNVAGTVNFGAGPITFYVGDQVLYSGTVWQRASGATGTVTSVAVTESGDALTITGSPITTSGTINIGFAGTGSQYIKGDGTLATFPTTIDQAKRLITEVYNSTGATLTKGTVVYINGGQGNLPTVTKAQANNDANSAQTYGVVQDDITNNNNGFVVVLGSLTDLDTSAYVVGTQLYLSGTTAGAWTSTKPSAPIHLVYVAIVVRSHPTQGVVEVRIQNGYELEELHDVAISAPVNNQGIFYNSSNDLWENKSIATALGYTPANDALVVHLAGTETITGLKSFDAALNLKVGAGAGGTGYIGLGSMTDNTLVVYNTTSGTTYSQSLAFPTGAGYTYTFPASSGTIALTSNLSSYVPYTGATTNVDLGASNNLTANIIYAKGGLSTDFGVLLKSGLVTTQVGYLNLSASKVSSTSQINLYTDSGFYFALAAPNTANYTYTFPASSGTVALTSNLSSYLPLSGGTLTGALNGTSATFSSIVTATADSNAAAFIALARSADDLSQIRFNNNANSNTNAIISVNKVGSNGGEFSISTKPDGSPLSTRLTIASTGAATFASSVTASGGVVIAGNASIASTAASIWSNTYLQFNSGSTGISFNNSNNTAGLFTILNTGAATFSSNLVAINGNGLTEFKINNNTSEWELYMPSGGTDLRLYRGSDKVTFLANGNVGIGTTSPVAIGSGYIGLSVAGDNTSGRGGYLSLMRSTTECFRIISNSSETGLYSTENVPIYFGTNGTERMRITSGGNVGIGATGYASTRLLVRGSDSTSSNYAFICENGGSNNLLVVRNDGVINTGTAAGSPYNNTSANAANLYVSSGGTLERATSSLKYKTDVRDYDKGLNELMQIQPKYYKGINDGDKQFAGLIAEQIHELGLTEFVQYAEDGTPDALAYTHMVAIVIKSIQELKQELDELKAKIN